MPGHTHTHDSQCLLFLLPKLRSLVDILRETTLPNQACIALHAAIRMLRCWGWQQRKGLFEAAKRGDGKTGLKSPSPKARGLGYLWVKSTGRSEMQVRCLEAGKDEAMAALHGGYWASCFFLGCLSKTRWYWNDPRVEFSARWCQKFAHETLTHTQLKGWWSWLFRSRWRADSKCLKNNLGERLKVHMSEMLSIGAVQGVLWLTV